MMHMATDNTKRLIHPPSMFFVHVVEEQTCFCCCCYPSLFSFMITDWAGKSVCLRWTNMKWQNRPLFHHSAARSLTVDQFSILAGDLTDRTAQNNPNHYRNVNGRNESLLIIFSMERWNININWIWFCFFDACWFFILVANGVQLIRIRYMCVPKYFACHICVWTITANNDVCVSVIDMIDWLPGTYSYWRQSKKSSVRWQNAH